MEIDIEENATLTLTMFKEKYYSKIQNEDSRLLKLRIMDANEDKKYVANKEKLDELTTFVKSIEALIEENICLKNELGNEICRQGG
jgi:predicted protein tyrosine phosphatase